MFKALAESLLGNWGTVLMDFILEHSVIFSVAVVAAGVFMIIKKRRNEARETEKTNRRRGTDEGT